MANIALMRIEDGRSVEITGVLEPMEIDNVETSDDDNGLSEDDEPPALRRSILVMMCIIQAYATTNGPLRHKFKTALHIADSGAVSNSFTQAAVFVQYGKFAMTLGQNIILACISPKLRVYLAMVLVFIGALVVPLVVYTLGVNWLGTVFFSYGLIGLGLGIFECTYLSVITPLGKLTKAWAIMGFPASFGFINVVLMSIVSVGLDVRYVFWYVALFVPVGAIIFRTMATEADDEDSDAAKDASSSSGHHASNEQVSFMQSMVQWRSWLPAVLPLAVANCVSHFVMENVGPAAFDTFNDKQVALFDPSSADANLMNTDRYLVVLNIFLLVGDMLSRRLAYCFRLTTLCSNLVAISFAILASVVGFGLALKGIAALTWFSTFLAFAGAGFNYGVTSKYIDSLIPKEHNLVAYSLWMFVGYGGAIAGTALVGITRDFICGDAVYPHQCRVH